MNTVKKVVIVLSVFCYIAIALYAICAIPMLFGYTPMPITDDRFGDGNDFPAGSMFYYHKADLSEMERGHIAVYKEGGKKQSGAILSAEEVAVTIAKKIIPPSAGGKQYDYSEEDVTTVPMSSVIGINKSPCIPLIGYYLDYIQNHVAVIVVIGVILALRVLFIYIDPGKEKKEEAAEGADSFEKKLGSLFGDAEITEDTAKQDEDIGSIFAQATEDKNVPNEEEAPASFESVLEKEESELPSQFKDEKDVDVAAVAAAAEKKENAENIDREVEKMEEAVKTPEEETKIPEGASDITDYINDLVFDSKDGSWYNATQVDEALDMITAKVYDALNSANSSSESEKELHIIRDEKADLEKKFIEKDAALAKANDELAAAEKKISEYEKAIENYKLMEQKVARLVAALKAEKSNG